MIYSIGDVVDFQKLHWSSDWDSTDIFGEDYPHDFAIGLYSEPHVEGEPTQVGYYIDLRDSKVMAIFLENEDEEDIETKWNEDYFV